MKDVRSQGGGSLSTADIFWTRGSSFLMQKNVGIFEIYGVSARTGG